MICDNQTSMGAFVQLIAPNAWWLCMWGGHGSAAKLSAYRVSPYEYAPVQCRSMGQCRAAAAGRRRYQGRVRRSRRVLMQPGCLKPLNFEPYITDPACMQAGGRAGGRRAAPARRRGGDRRGRVGAAQPGGAGAARVAGAAARARGRCARVRGRQRRVLHLHGRAVHAQAALRPSGEDPRRTPCLCKALSCLALHEPVCVPCNSCTGPKQVRAPVELAAGCGTHFGLSRREKRNGRHPCCVTV